MTMTDDGKKLTYGKVILRTDQWSVQMTDDRLGYHPLYLLNYRTMLGTVLSCLDYGLCMMISCVDVLGVGLYRVPCNQFSVSLSSDANSSRS